MPEERAPIELYDIEETVQKLRHVLGDHSFEEIKFEEIKKDFVEGVALRERLRASGELPLPPPKPKAD
jgi:hypothetical protein